MLDEREAELFRRLHWPRRAAGMVQCSGWCCCAGRRAGKDRFASAVGVWAAALCADWREYMCAGEVRGDADWC